MRTNVKLIKQIRPNLIKMRNLKQFKLPKSDKKQQI
jgi:hypothetical protein